jgi:hypothetical protein
MAPGGKARIDPVPNAANRRPAGLSPVTAPASRVAFQAQCTAFWVRSRRHLLPGKLRSL